MIQQKQHFFMCKFINQIRQQGLISSNHCTETPVCPCLQSPLQLELKKSSQSWIFESSEVSKCIEFFRQKSELFLSMVVVPGGPPPDRHRTGRAYMTDALSSSHYTPRFATESLVQPNSLYGEITGPKFGSKNLTLSSTMGCWHTLAIFTDRFSQIEISKKMLNNLKCLNRVKSLLKNQKPFD